jgi:hypothetical protein
MRDSANQRNFTIEHTSSMHVVVKRLVSNQHHALRAAVYSHISN